MRYLVLFLALGLCACPGPQGPSGLNGSSCTVTMVPNSSVTPNGGALMSCTDGTQALILNGSNGTNGTNGTVITPVQLCKNPVTTYSNTFAEVAFCINGKLYGVYSANDGFLSPLPNGTYSSDGINASCTFTITGCTVSNQSN